MKDLLLTDNPVIISRVSALLEAEGIEFVVLGAHASLFGGGIGPIQTTVMVEQRYHTKAVKLIRQLGLEDDVELKL
ncbi:MAG: DUF2007 domain-containing protein [Proteobacteria bacterium]|jgi:hypothetical protein|nr:DUF2007 domain-containing protein [Pseudomonadota bacterium]